MPAKKISISIDRCRERQFDLSINGLSYGEYMHLGNAKMLAGFGQGLLLDLQQQGIIDPSIQITFTDNSEKKNAGISGNIEEAVRARGTRPA
jgi:hypothetical protein